MKTTLTIIPHAISAGLLLMTFAAFAQPRPIDGRPDPIRPGPNPPQQPIPAAGQLGGPLLNLTPAQLADFLAGREEFANVETPASGLGPIFNNVSCAACHFVPATGGASEIFVTRFGRVVNGQFDPLTEKGGSLLQQFAINPAAREIIPREANVIARRQTTPLFGLGLLEAIPDGVIAQNALRPNPDGIKGRAAVVPDVVSGQMRIGRFGWKAQQATLLAFAGDAYLNEMGITSRFFPHENAPNGNTNLLARFDVFADPEDEIDPQTGTGDIDLAANFMRLLAPPPRGPSTASGRAGEPIFGQIGCALCHLPAMFSGPNSIAALSQKRVDLYSDLLLHDMGSLGDGIGQGAAGPREMKTAPLWGLRASAPYLHDGRAGTIEDAIRLHDGEGARSRDRFLRLPPGERRQLLDFLNSL